LEEIFQFQGVHKLRRAFGLARAPFLPPITHDSTRATAFHQSFFGVAETTRTTAFHQCFFGVAETAQVPLPTRATAFHQCFFGVAETAQVPLPARETAFRQCFFGVAETARATVLLFVGLILPKSVLGTIKLRFTHWISSLEELVDSRGVGPLLIETIKTKYQLSFSREIAHVRRLVSKNCQSGDSC
jgi:hypothetical protein